jgi:hypothetical protein
MKKGLGWPIGVAAILTIVVVANIWVAVIANDDPSFSIEPDYYQKAVAWDSSMAQARHNTSLNWSLTPSLGAFAAGGGAVLRVRLTDSTGAVIHDARIQVAALYNARASTIYTATLGHDGPDAYAVTLPVRHAGEWELRFDVTRGAERFTATARVEAIPAGAP